MSRGKKVVMFFPCVAETALPAVAKIIKSRWIGQGQTVADFEERVKKIFGIPYAAAVNHVSSAIRLALAITGVGPGDEVITTPQTCTATNHPILRLSKRPG
jgi:UDP-4-amino-4-deoxy-L-arabinose-oxoglutarate aminotransferase